MSLETDLNDFAWSLLDKFAANGGQSLDFAKFEKTEGGFLEGPGYAAPNIEQGLEDIKEKSYQLVLRPSTSLVSSFFVGEPSIKPVPLVLTRSSHNRNIDDYYQNNRNKEVHFKKVYYYGYVFVGTQYTCKLKGEWENAKILRLYELPNSDAMIVILGSDNYYEEFIDDKGTIVDKHSRAGYTNNTRNVS